MDESLDVTLRLLDRMSPTLAVMDSHLAGTTRALVVVEKALRDLDMAERRAAVSFEKDPTKKYRMGLELMRSEIEESKNGTGGFLKQLKAIAPQAALIAGPLTVAGAAFVGFGMAAAEGAMGVLKFAVHAASQKRNTMMAFTQMEGSKEAAQESYRRFSYLADRTPSKESDILSYAKTLRGTGFDVRESEILLAGMSDVAAMQGENGPEALKSLMHGIAKIRGLGTMNAETLESITTGGQEAGLNRDNIAAAVAKRRNVSLDQARKLMGDGKIGATEGIETILDVIQDKVDKGGPLGTATKLFGQKSLDGQMSTFESRMESLFADVNLDPLVEVLGNVNALLDKDSPTGQRIRQFANETIGGMFKWLGEKLTPENIEKALTWITDTAEDVKRAFLIVQPLLGAFFDGASDGFLQVEHDGGPFRALLDGIGEGMPQETVDRWKDFGRNLGLLVSWTIELTEKMGWLAGKLALVKGLLPGPTDALPMPMQMALKTADVVAAASAPRPRSPVSFERDAGLNAAAGFASGLQAGTAPVAQAGDSLGQSALDATTQVLEIHSPSRAMRRLGAHAAEGFRAGVEDADVAGSLRALVEVGSSTSGASPNRRAATRPSVSVTIAAVNLHGVTDAAPVELARAIREALRVELAALFEEMENAA